jgi:hypothetical protein
MLQGLLRYADEVAQSLQLPTAHPDPAQIGPYSRLSSQDQRSCLPDPAQLFCTD